MAAHGGYEPPSSLSRHRSQLRNLALPTPAECEQRDGPLAAARACRGTTTFRLPSAAHPARPRRRGRQSQAALPGVSRRGITGAPPSAETPDVRGPHPTAGGHATTRSLVDRFHARHAGGWSDVSRAERRGDCTRECLAIEVDRSLPGGRVVRVLERLAATVGLPQRIVLDNGPEFSGRTLDAWAYQRGVALCFIRSGKPIENAYVESFNGKFRDECLNEHGC